MARVTTITCDGCGKKIEDGPQRESWGSTATLTLFRDLCGRCYLEQTRDRTIARLAELDKVKE